MEKQKLSEKESLEVITSMISRTKDRLHIGDGNILLLWGYLTIAVTALIWSLLVITHHPSVNWLWFLIWIIGGIVTPIITKKKRRQKGIKSYTDKISDGIWSIVGFIAIICTAICLFFMLFLAKDVWSMMLTFALVVIGMTEASQGLVIREKSLIVGGLIGTTIGLITLACVIGQITLYANWYFPLFITAFICMMIIPGHIINHKAKSHERA